MDNIFGISIDYSKTVAQANKLSRVANNCLDVHRDALKEIRFIQSDWQGKTGDALSEKLNAFEKKLTAVVNNLQQISYDMKRVAEEVRQADLEAMSNILG